MVIIAMYVKSLKTMKLRKTVLKQVAPETRYVVVGSEGIGTALVEVNMH